MSKNKFSFTRVLIVTIPIALIFAVTFRVLGTTTLRQNITYKAHQEINYLNTAIKQYKDLYGEFPETKSETLNFGEHFSNTSVNSSHDGKRHLYFNFNKNNIAVSNNKYDKSKAKETIIYDPYGTPYKYKIIKVNDLDTFKIISAGPDKTFDTLDDLSSNN